MTPWPTAGQSLADIRKAAAKVRTMGINLVVLAMPASAGASTPEEFHQHYAWTMNLSLSFGPQQWDVVVALPSVASPQLTPEELSHEDFARRLIGAQDLNVIAREGGDNGDAAGVLSKWLKAQLGAAAK